MAEKEAIGNMVEDNEIAKDTTLNGNGGPGADGSLEDMFEEAPFPKRLTICYRKRKWVMVYPLCFAPSDCVNNQMIL